GTTAANGECGNAWFTCLRCRTVLRSVVDGSTSTYCGDMQLKLTSFSAGESPKNLPASPINTDLPTIGPRACKSPPGDDAVTPHDVDFSTHCRGQHARRGVLGAPRRTRPLVRRLVRRSRPGRARPGGIDRRLRSGTGRRDRVAADRGVGLH